MDWSNWSDVATVFGGLAATAGGVIAGINFLVVAPMRKEMRAAFVNQEKRFDDQKQTVNIRIGDLIARMGATDVRLEAASSRLDARINALSNSVEKIVYSIFRDGRHRG